MRALQEQSVVLALKDVKARKAHKVRRDLQETWDLAVSLGLRELPAVKASRESKDLLVQWASSELLVSLGL